MELIMENIRCFDGRHTIPVKPLTLLVGENSSGKTTFLTALAAVSNPFSFPLRPRFNDPPYSLGNFDTIATYKGGKYGRAKSFSLGYIFAGRSDRDEIELVATYTGKQGQIVFFEAIGKNAMAEIAMSAPNDKETPPLQFSIAYKGEKYFYNLPTVTTVDLFSPFDTRYMFYFAYKSAAGKNLSQKILFELEEMFGQVHLPRTLSVAPIRTKPKRTYDQVTEEFTPEGDHVPFVLADLLANESFKAILERFGTESGLFKEVGIRKLGNKISDPIQVMVTSSGRPANLLDVGYGVSQALPVIVQSVLAAKERVLLLQQPEVHLHPRAQAALGSFFVDMLTDGGKQFVVETHSDYIIDRVRQEVAKGKVAADQVSILYFEKEGNEARVYPLALDKMGNICNAPPTYRAFFLREELNLFNRTGY